MNTQAFLMNRDGMNKETEFPALLKLSQGNKSFSCLKGKTLLILLLSDF